MPDISGQRHFEPASEGVAVDSRDDRHRQVLLESILRIRFGQN
jgi:hypothetical protein